MLFILGLYHHIFGLFLYPYIGFTVWWIGIIVGINFFFGLFIRRELKKIKFRREKGEYPETEDSKKSSIQKFIEMMTKENPYHDNISLKMEIVRKSFHLWGILFILAYFGFFFMPPLADMTNRNVIDFINETEWLYNLIWGDVDKYPYKKNDFQAVIDITMFSLIGALFFTIIPDIIRVLWGPEYSFLNFITKPVLRYKEFNSIGPQIYLLVAVSFSYMLFIMGVVHVLVVFTGILIACFSDALAAIFGRFYGKHKVKCVGGDVKSIEGFIAGTSSAFLISLIFLGPVYALMAALIFFLLDYFPTYIADNILNPIVIIVAIHLGIFLFGIPIGWN
jgi:dolichol kinase